MASTTEPQTIAHAQRSLLESGEFSDLTITCHGRVWKCHRAILCPRCPFFRAALSGDFSESQTATINLDHDHPDGVQVMLEFLYTLEVPSFAKVSAATVYLLADKYSLLVLRKAGKRYLIQVWASRGMTLTDLPDSGKLFYLGLIRELWSWKLSDTREIKDSALEGLCSSAQHGALLQYEDFQNLLMEHKEFCLDFVTALAKAPHQAQGVMYGQEQLKGGSGDGIGRREDMLMDSRSL